MSLTCSRRREGASSGMNAFATARTVAGLFFPQSRALGIDRGGLSPKLLQKAVYAGTNSSSFQQAARDLDELSESKISPKQVERLIKRIGQERVDQRDARVKAFQAYPLVNKSEIADKSRPAPPVAMVSTDGGRMQIRGPRSESSSHWRESKAAVLETYQSGESEVDPDPDVPRCFLNLDRTTKLVRGLGHALPKGLEDVGDEKQQKHSRRRNKSRPGRPKRLVRSVLASRARAEDFGAMMHEAAFARNFFAAPRRAFLGDGQASNWSIHREHFSTFEPILDFVHALTYVFAAALAGRARADGFAIYKRWIQTVWSGQVETLLHELEARVAQLGEPPPECSDSDPRKLVFEALRYLRNNAERMRYDKYRCKGLPIMTSAVESVIKQINRRVKGSEKFWSEGGAEAILQLRADFLSETEPMKKFWADRETNMTGVRPYRRAA